MPTRSKLDVLLEVIYGTDEEIAAEIAAMTDAQVRERLRESGVTDERMQEARARLRQMLTQSPG